MCLGHRLSHDLIECLKKVDYWDHVTIALLFMFEYY